MGYKRFNKIQKHPLGQPFQKEIYHTAFPKRIFQKHYPKLTSSVFMIDSPKRMKSLERNWNDYDWGTIYIHEVFHLFQDSKWSKEIIGKDEIINSEPLQALKRNKKNINLIIEEQKIIKNALLKYDFSNKESIIKICKELIPRRQNRYKYVENQIKHSIKSEQFYETLEGTARYIEKHIDLYSISDPKKHKYINNDLLGYLKEYGTKTYFYMLDQIEVGENYFYETGFAFSLLLDKLDPSWKEQAFKKTLWEQVLNKCDGLSE